MISIYASFWLNSPIRHHHDPHSKILRRNEFLISVDARKPFGYEIEHIPGAINLPHREMTAENTKDLDRNAIYVTYCDGIGCNASTRGAINLTKLGFTVRELMGGIEWWKFDGYQTEGTRAAPGQAIQCAC